MPGRYRSTVIASSLRLAGMHVVFSNDHLWYRREPQLLNTDSRMENVSNWRPLSVC